MTFMLEYIEVIPIEVHSTVEFNTQQESESFNSHKQGTKGSFI